MYLLPAACCFLPAACCLLPATYCLLPAACSLLPAAYLLLPAACCLLPAAYLLLPAACYLLPAYLACRHHLFISALIPKSLLVLLDHEKIIVISSNQKPRTEFRVDHDEF
jgi:hypothetical protein